jgi:uncharacterized integral membrane protein
MTEPEPAALEPAAPEPPRRNEARAWLIVLVLALAVAYVVAFGVKNTGDVSIHWIFGTTRSSLIWVIFLSLVLGAIVGVLVSHLGRRRRRGSQAPDR